VSNGGELAYLKFLLFTVVAGKNMARRSKPVFLVVDMLDT
jgi:hypothetical protein